MGGVSCPKADLFLQFPEDGSGAIQRIPFEGSRSSESPVQVLPFECLQSVPHRLLFGSQDDPLGWNFFQNDQNPTIFQRVYILGSTDESWKHRPFLKQHLFFALSLKTGPVSFSLLEWLCPCLLQVPGEIYHHLSDSLKP